MFHFIHNSALHSISADAHVLGIEATIPGTIARCDLGNIDPQHGGGCPLLDGGLFRISGEMSAAQWTLSAVVAGEFSVPSGTYLVTDRVDLDSVATMALLSLPTADLESADLYRRVRILSAADNFDCGEWPGPRPLPTLESPWLTHGGAIEDIVELAAPNWICGWATPGGGNRLTLEQAVQVVGYWLLHGDSAVEGHWPMGLRGHAPVDLLGAEDGGPTAVLYLARHEALARRFDTIRAMWTGGIRMEGVFEVWDGVGTLTRETARIYPDVGLMGRRPLAVVTGLDGTRPAPASFAYCLAPVSVVQMRDPRSGFLRFSVSAFSETEWDRDATLVRLTALEPGWGGSRTILGSPQDRDTTLTIEQVLEAMVLR